MKLDLESHFTRLLLLTLSLTGNDTTTHTTQHVYHESPFSKCGVMLRYFNPTTRNALFFPSMGTKDTIENTHVYGGGKHWDNRLKSVLHSSRKGNIDATIQRIFA